MMFAEPRTAVLKFMCVAASALLLAGCPLFGGGDSAQGSSNNPDFDVALSGEGVTKTGPYAYRVTLDSPSESVKTVQLAATLDRKPVRITERPVSSAPGVVRVDGPDQLAALEGGSARIDVVYLDNRVELALEVVAEKLSGDTFKVTSPSMRDVKGPTEAFRTDNYKYGNGGFADLPTVWATILDSQGKPVSKDRCRLFVGKVTPRVITSGWPGDDRGHEGKATFTEYLNGWNDGEEGMQGCGFQVMGGGFPIIGSGAQEFSMNIYWTCVGKFDLPECGSPGFPACASSPSTRSCGKPLPGSPIKFKIARQSMDECEYCEGR